MQNGKKYMLYVHIFPNNKKYYGITCSKYPSTRWQRGRGYKTCPAVYNAIQKYGWDNIQHKILYKNLTENEAFELERKYIEECNVDIGNGYNLSKSGTLGNTGIYIDYSGKKYNSLTFIKRTDFSERNGSYKWELLCDCVKTIVASPANVISGSIKSCGCLKKEKMIEKMQSYIGTTHGFLECVDVDLKMGVIKCQCKCGNSVSFTKKQWWNGRKSCGCLKDKTSRENLNIARKQLDKEVITTRNVSIKNAQRKNAKQNTSKFMCVETGMVFNSGYEVDEYFGKRVYSNILKVLKNQIKTAYGYHWEYI